MENQEEVWDQIAEYGTKNSDVPKEDAEGVTFERAQPKFTEGKNTSKRLQDEYKNINLLVTNSIRDLHHRNKLTEFNKKFFEHMHKEAKKAYDAKTTNKTTEKRKRMNWEDDPDETADWNTMVIPAAVIVVCLEAAV